MLRDLRYEHHFLFTQYSLNTFSNCPLKFKKRYLENLKWDSFPDETIKKRVEMGNKFHLLAYRYFRGTEPGMNEDTIEFAELNRWFIELKKAFPLETGTVYLPEYKIRMVTPGLKLEANFDLIIIKDGLVEIWDWKTHHKDAVLRIKSQEIKLRESLQTIVYMFVLREQCKNVLKKSFTCDQIKMCYWQPEKPNLIAEIRYNEEMHETFRIQLTEKIKDVLNYDFNRFDKSLYMKHCKVCEFNWFCNNEKVNFEDIKEDERFLDDLDWDGIEEKY
ncbi:MAG: PD-(D/E)XK nuclease family protein [Clostridia bacterium]|nr:PD-(D/E)XK nuclease family protein [Clostridia bacterium]